MDSEALQQVRQQQIRQQRKLVENLQFAVYSLTDPMSDPDLHARLREAEQQLRDLEKVAPLAEDDSAEVRPNRRGNFLGPDTTGLQVGVRLCMDPLPTGVYHLMDPETDPLVVVEIENVPPSRDTRRILVRVFIEGLSAEAVQTVEIKPRGKATLKLLPTLFPASVKMLTEVQRATLHVVVDDLDGKLESHNTYTITCLSRTASFNSVRRPDTDELVDLSHYYGAWVTPYVDVVQDRVRAAVSKMPDNRMLGYQGDPDVVPQQVSALYQSLREAEIVYVNSVIDYGAASGLSTQRTRLPRESLSARSANCIDGTVLLASLIEGISLNPAILLVPGHALVGWETWHDSGDWQFLETTMIGTGDFDAACASGQRQYEQYSEFNQDRIKLHSVSELRGRGVWPME